MLNHMAGLDVACHWPTRDNMADRPRRTFIFTFYTKARGGRSAWPTLHGTSALSSARVQ